MIERIFMIWWKVSHFTKLLKSTERRFLKGRMYIFGRNQDMEILIEKENLFDTFNSHASTLGGGYRASILVYI